MLWTPEGGAQNDKKRSMWFPVDGARVPAAWSGGNVYFGVNPATVRREAYQATTNDTVACVNALYAEWDGKDFAEPSEDAVNDAYDCLRADPAYAAVPDDKLYDQAQDEAKNALFLTDIAAYKELALDHVLGLVPAPTVLWDSGGGYQGVWLLTEPVLLGSDTDRERLSAIQHEWAQFVGADRGVCDLRRVLRLPGTVNHKKKYAPDYPRVSFLYEDYDRRYSLDDLVAHLADPNATTDDDGETLTRTAPGDDSDLIITTFNRLVDVKSLLLSYGYTNGGDRLSRPGDKESKGVVIHADTNTSLHWSSHDALHSEHARTPFDIWCYYACQGDAQVAYQALRDGLFATLRLWVRTTSFSELIPAERRTEVYRTDSTDTKVADAVLDLMAHAGKLGVRTGKKRLGKLAGVAPNTAQSALLRLGGWLFDIAPTAKGGLYVKFASEFQSTTLAPQFVRIIGRGQDECRNEYSGRKSNEPFLAGTSQYIKRQARQMAVREEQKTGQDVTVKSILLTRFFKSVGETGLRILDALVRCGDMTAIELSAETGKKISGIRSGIKRLELYGLVAAGRENAREPKVYSLTLDVWDKLEVLAPEMRTYTLTSQRENVRLRDSQRAAIRAYHATTNAAERHELERRMARLAKERIPHLARMFSDLGLTPDALADLAGDEVRSARAYGVRQPLSAHPATIAKMKRLHGEARLDVSEQQRVAAHEREQRMLDTAWRLRQQGINRFEWYSKFVLAGYTNNEVRQFMASSSFRSNFTSQKGIQHE